MESTRREKYEYDIVINERELEEIQEIITLVKKIGDEKQVEFLTDMFFLGKIDPKSGSRSNWKYFY